MLFANNKLHGQQHPAIAGQVGCMYVMLKGTQTWSHCYSALTLVYEKAELNQLPPELLAK